MPSVIIICNCILVAAGAKALIPEDLFPIAKPCVFLPFLTIMILKQKMDSGTTYVAPQVLVDVNHCMSFTLCCTFVQLTSFVAMEVMKVL
jgi:hypothetical protein